jgi:ABC-type Mn2+/Zn2+ transport system ATPase subunit
MKCRWNRENHLGVDPQRSPTGYVPQPFESIVEAGSVVEEVVRIGHHRRLSSLVTSYEVRPVAYCFHSIEILMKYTH